MAVPFILDIVALIDVSTLEFLLTEVGVALLKMERLFDTNAKDKANMTGLASTSASSSFDSNTSS